METPLTPLEFARRARALYADRLAVVDGDVRLTYREFFARCDRQSAALARMGVGKGDRVAVISANSLAMLELFYAVPQMGAVLVPINYRLTADDFAYIIGHSGARVVFAEGAYIADIDSVRSRLENVEHFLRLDGAPGDGWENGVPSGSSDDWTQPELAESELVTINYTSGTTARPKGVMMTHRNAWTNTVGTLVHLPMQVGEPYLWTLPMFHCNGWTYVWTVTAVGGVHVCLPKVDAARVFELIRKEKVRWLCAAPTVLIMLANAPAEVRGEVPRGVKVVTAGAPPAAATIERIEDDFGWDVTHVYGLTETAPFITVCEPRPEHGGLSEDDRAVVKARQGVELITSGELRVVDEEGREVPHDGESRGEIVVRGNVVMAGYYNDPEATAQAMRGGWFHSGDAAVVHADGYVQICDRLKDVIISGGENISSIEVEGVLLRHPSVLEVAVVGLPHPVWGESPHAFVVLKPGCALTEDALCAYAREHLAGFKVPRGATFIPELPKTATGKVQKFVLRKGAPAIVPQ